MFRYKLISRVLWYVSTAVHFHTHTHAYTHTHTHTHTHIQDSIPSTAPTIHVSCLSCMAAGSSDGTSSRWILSCIPSSSRLTWLSLGSKSAGRWNLWNFTITSARCFCTKNKWPAFSLLAALTLNVLYHTTPHHTTHTVTPNHKIHAPTITGGSLKKVRVSLLCHVC